MAEAVAKQTHPPKPAEKPDRQASTTGQSIRDKVRALRNRSQDGLRQIRALDDFSIGIEPNGVATKPPETMMMRPTDLWVDAAYQRDLSRASMNLLVKIINNWDWRKFKPPVVALDADNRYVVIDGQHTSIAAASHPDIDRIPVLFVAMPDVKDQAEAFVSHNTSRVVVTPLDLFQARVAAGNEEAVEINSIVKNNDIVIRRFVPGAQGYYEANETVAIGVLGQLYRQYGPIRFSEILKTASKCGFTQIKADHFRAIALLLYHRGDADVQISAEMLTELISSLNNADAIMNADRIAKTTGQTKAQGLAMYWRNEYRKHYGTPRSR